MIEKEGKTTEAAIEAALQELQLSEEEVNVEILRKEGLFKTACVRVTPKQTKAEKAYEFVSELVRLMKLNTTVELIDQDGEQVVNLTGADNGIAIGYRGEALDAIQYLALLASNKNAKEYTKIVVDAENYRNKRKITLENLAGRLADRALSSGRSVEVEPMNAYERKVFHSALADFPNIKTESEGEEPNRYIVITPVKSSNDKEVLNDFSRKGFGKMKSFGAKKRKF